VTLSCIVREQHGGGEERDRTFPRGLPQRMVFGTRNNGVGYDLVLFDRSEPTKIDLDAIDAKLSARICEGGAVPFVRSAQLRRGSFSRPTPATPRISRPAQGRANQSRPQPASAVSGRTRVTCTKAADLHPRCSSIAAAAEFFSLAPRPEGRRARGHSGYAQ